MMRREEIYLHLPNCERVMNLSEEGKYFVNMIVKRNEMKCTDKKGFTYIRSVDLKDIFSRHSKYRRKWKYKEIEKELAGVVEIDYKWAKGVRSKGFKLTDEVKNVKLTRYKMRSGKFAERISNYRMKKLIVEEAETTEMIIKNTKGIRKGQELTAKKFLDRNNERIGIRKEAAMAYINNEENIKSIIEKNEKTRSKKKPKQTETDVWNHYYMKVENIANGEISKTKVSNTGRYFNEATNYPKKLRMFLIDKKDPFSNIFELDIKNSQPYCVIILIKEYYENEIREGMNKGIEKSLCGDIFEKMDNDVKFYIKLVSEGGIYEYFMARLGIEKDRRDEFKVKFYKGFFFCNQKKCNREILKVFEEDFPNVLKVVRFYKSFDCSKVQKLDEDLKNGKKGIHCNFIRRLQRIESDLIINKVIRRIAKERGEMFAVTVHDSIICEERNAEYAERIMKEEIKKMFGILPQIGKNIIALNEIRIEMAG